MNPQTDPTTSVFEEARPRLLGLAYRMLGSYDEAEDIVQDCYIRWLNADAASIYNPPAWLTTVTTRLCLDHLKSAHHNRMRYVGPWLPEPVGLTAFHDAQRELEMTDSISTAFLLLLERLSPMEGAAYLLHEIFGYDYPEVAEILGNSPSSCRQLVSRAGKRIGQPTRRQSLPEDRKQQYLDAFLQALRHGDIASLTSLLADDVELHSDSNGKVQSARKILTGRPWVMRFFEKGLTRFWAPLDLQLRPLNGSTGLLVTDGDRIHATVTFNFTPSGRIRGIYMTRNPEKLTHILDP